MTPVPASAPVHLPLSGIDVSANQSDAVLADWLPKVDFVIVKATEGKGYNAPAYAHQMAEVRASGKKAGAYHYAWPENGWAADFNHFSAVAGLQVGEVPVLDFEPWAKRQPLANPATFADYILGWKSASLIKWGVAPVLYIPDYFVAQVRQHCTDDQWNAISSMTFFKPGVNGAYVPDPGKGPGDTLGFQSVGAWQWTDSPLDEDILYSSWDDIAIKKVA